MLFGQLADARPGHQLVDSRQRKLEEAPELFPVEIRPAVAELEEAGEVVFEEARVERLGVERFGDEVTGLRGREEVGQVAGRVRREEDDFAALGETERRESGHRRLADAPLPSEKDDAARGQRFERVA